MRSEWTGFVGGKWEEEVNVRDFIQKNYTPYEGDDSFLCGPTDATNKLWAQVMELSKEEREKGGVLDMDTKIPSTITSQSRYRNFSIVSGLFDFLYSSNNLLSWLSIVKYKVSIIIEKNNTVSLTW